MEQMFGFSIFDLEKSKARSALNDCRARVAVSEQNTLESATASAWRNWDSLSPGDPGKEAAREAWKEADEERRTYEADNRLTAGPQNYGPSLWEIHYCMNNPAGSMGTTRDGWGHNNARTDIGTCW